MDTPLIYHLKKYFKPRFFISKAFCSTLNGRIGELENSIFDVTMSLVSGEESVLGQCTIWQYGIPVVEFSREGYKIKKVFG
jgi:hypothetical protein